MFYNRPNPICFFGASTRFSGWLFSSRSDHHQLQNDNQTVIQCAVKPLELWSWQRRIQDWIKLQWSPKCDRDVKKTNFKYYSTTGTEIEQCAAVQVSSKNYFNHLAVRNPVPTENWSCYIHIRSSNHQSPLTKPIILACRTEELLVYLCRGCLVCFCIMWLSRASLDPK